MDYPKAILLFSGKRKCGKDFICEKIRSILGDGTCTIIRISGPLKGLYASHHNLDIQQLMGDGPYKETYRQAMIQWSDEIRLKDPGYFCRAACEEAEKKTVWIVSDIRRKSDIRWFQDNYKNKTKLVRVEADQEARINRGWVFTQGVDDVPSECNLDDFEDWDFRIDNSTDEKLKHGVEQIFSFIKNFLN